AHASLDWSRDESVPKLHPYGSHQRARDGDEDVREDVARIGLRRRPAEGPPAAGPGGDIGSPRFGIRTPREAMNARCPHCQTLYRMDPARVPAGGTLARCARCRQSFRVGPAAAPTWTMREPWEGPREGTMMARPDAPPESAEIGRA